jgi:primosomal protein N''
MVTNENPEQEGALEKAKRQVERMAARSGLLGTEKRLMAEIVALEKKSKKASAEAATISTQMESEIQVYSNPDKFRMGKGRPIVSLPGYPNKLNAGDKEKAFQAVLEAIFADVRREHLLGLIRAKYAERDETEKEIGQKRQELNACRSALVN